MNQKEYVVVGRKWSLGIALERKGRAPKSLRELAVYAEEQILKALGEYKSLKECSYSFRIGR